MKKHQWRDRAIWAILAIVLCLLMYPIVILIVSPS